MSIKTLPITLPCLPHRKTDSKTISVYLKYIFNKSFPFKKFVHLLNMRFERVCVESIWPHNVSILAEDPFNWTGTAALALQLIAHFCMNAEMYFEYIYFSHSFKKKKNHFHAV